MIANPHVTRVAAPIRLADRKILLGKAEEIARQSMRVLEERVRQARSVYKSDKEFGDALSRAPGIGHDALGWVLFAQGRLDEAEQELLKAHEIGGANRENLYHLGRFYEAKNDIARAEEYYVKGLNVQRPGPNPSDATLRALYEKRHGSAEGYDTYVTDIRERDRTARKEKILASRINTPEPVTTFSLKSLDGNRVMLDSLRGKTAVINFWGIWCGWCVQEMPDFQKLHEKYKADPDVAILTINTHRYRLVSLIDLSSPRHRPHRPLNWQLMSP